MDDKDKRMAEMETLLREAQCIMGVDRDWTARARVILAPPPDPDAGANEVFAVWSLGHGGGEANYRPSLLGESNTTLGGWRAVAAWAHKRVAEAEKRGRIAGLQDARDGSKNPATVR